MLIKGIRTEKIHHKISLYGDDILQFLQDPLNSIKEKIKVINSFANISGYSINWNKSSVLSLQHKSQDTAANTLPIPLCIDHITYLGIRVSPRLSELFTLNFTPPSEISARRPPTLDKPATLHHGQNICYQNDCST